MAISFTSSLRNAPVEIQPATVELYAGAMPASCAAPVWLTEDAVPPEIRSRAVTARAALALLRGIGVDPPAGLMAISASDKLHVHIATLTADRTGALVGRAIASSSEPCFIRSMVNGEVAMQAMIDMRGAVTAFSFVEVTIGSLSASSASGTVSIEPRFMGATIDSKTNRGAGSEVDTLARKARERGESWPMCGAPTPEQAARDMLERMGVDGAQSFSSGEVGELAGLIAEVLRLRVAVSP